MFRRNAGRTPIEGPQHGLAFRTSFGAARQARSVLTAARRLAISLVAALALLAGSASLAPALLAADPPEDPYDLAVDAPVLIVLGQSNAVGWSTPISDALDVDHCASFTHVKGLKREGNREVGALNAIWTPYTCAGSNLGQERSANYSTYNVATGTALRWERAITQEGKHLPDLNVIHVAWGGQGIQELDGKNGSANRWWPERDPTDIDSLHQLTLNTISNGLRALQDAGKRPRIIGIHWNQWETETAASQTTGTSQIQQAFLNVLDPIRTIAGGGTSTPIFLYRPSRQITPANATRTQYITEALTGLASLPEPNPYELIDPTFATTATGTALYKASDAPNFGIFDGDGTHYTRAVHEWFVDQQWKSVFTDGRIGEPVQRTMNAAQGMPATQSSTYRDVPIRAANKAVDGNSTSSSLSHTKLDTNAWWQVDLGSLQPIRDVRVLNRTDCCQTRLSNFHLVVSATDQTGRSLAEIQSDPDPTIKRVWVKGTAPDQILLPAGVNGRYVRIQLAGTDYLALKEVLVDVPAPDGPDNREPRP
ncbi:discoidin domain-containing protein [Streptomyces sp. NPDC056401]|uniref:galactose-binding domain-containing protein n=1 Tax=Streptomyces sp. NPDC056401 TaxID=3345809 RepID=UPI0035DD5E79